MDEVEDRLRAAAAALEERGLCTELGFGQRPAVLVVDFARAFTDPALPLGSDLTEELAAARRLLGAARSKGHPVYFTTIAYDDPDLADAGVWAVKVPANAGLRAGTPEVEIDRRLDRRRGEAVVVKKYASAFFGTDLATRLRSHTVDTLLVAGCSTSGCVRASVVDGLQHGFRVIVVHEAVGDRDPAAHVQSLLDMQAKYADVLSLADVEPRLAAMPVR